MTVSADGLVTLVGAGTDKVVLSHPYLGSSHYTYTIDTALLPDGIYFLKNRGTSYYADISGQTMSNGTDAVQYEFTGDNSQRWSFEYFGDQYYCILSANSSTYYYLGVENDSTANDTQIEIRTGNVTDGMKWKIENASNGSYKIIPKSGEAYGKVIAVNNNSNSNDDLIVQKGYSYDDNYRDEWLLKNINLQLDTPLIAQPSYAGWCWAASAQMMARTLYPTLANIGDSTTILNEQREAVHYIKGDSSATASSYDWTNDPQGLYSQGGSYDDVAKATAFMLANMTDDISVRGDITPYEEAKLIRFLHDGYPICRLYEHFGIEYDISSLNIDDIIESINLNMFGHVTVITGVSWSNLENCYKYTVYDPAGGVFYSRNYSELINRLMISNSETFYEIWFPTTVIKTDYSNQSIILYAEYSNH